MVQGKINRCRHTDHPAGRHSIRTNQCPPPPSPIFFTGRMPFLPPNQQCQRKLKLLYCEIAAKSESSQCALTAMSCSAVICQFLLLQIRLPYCRFCHAAQGTCYDNSVCLSVTLKWSVKTARHIIQPSNHLSATVVLVCSRLPNSYFKLSKANSLETTALDALINKQEITRQRHSHYRHTDHHHDYLIGRFPGEPGSSSSASVSASTCSGRESLGTSGSVILWAGHPSSNHKIKALTATCGPASCFLHPLPDSWRKGLAPMMMTLWRQYL